MDTFTQPSKTDSLNILLVGNNPIEMGKVLENFQRVRGQRIITEIAFDLKSILERLVRFNPNYIFIDDNIGRSELLETIKKLSADKKTQEIPITVLKNSNYHEALGSSSILDYLLKQNLTPEMLYNTIRNSIKGKRTQQYLYQSYQKRKEQLAKLIRG